MQADKLTETVEPAIGFRAWLAWSIEQARYNRDALDPKAAEILTNVLERFEALAALSRPNVDETAALTYLESEARRFADFYPDGSDGRNTFVIFADKVAALRGSADNG